MNNGNRTKVKEVLGTKVRNQISIFCIQMIQVADYCIVILQQYFVINEV